MYTKVSTYTQPGYERPDAFMITSAVRNETTGQIDVHHTSFTNASHAEQEQWSQLADEYSEVDPRQDVGLSAEERALANQYADVEVDESLGTGVTYFVKDTPKENKADMMSMTNNATLSQLQSFLGSAQAALPQAQAEIQNIKSQITACQQKVSSLATQIQNKQMTIDGYRTQVNQEERMIHALQQEYSSLIDQAANAQSEEELRAIQERVKTIRAQAEQHQAKAEQYKAQMQKAEQEKAQLVQEQNAWKAKLQQWKSHLSAFQGKCRQTATHIGRYGSVARSESAKLNRQGTAFAQGADGRFRTEMRNAAQWRSSDAQVANNLANQLDNVARGFRALASSSESDHEREIER